MPTIDLVIPVHSRTRPISRAVSSVLEHTKTSVRVTVVAHNIDRNVIEANLGDWANDARLRLLELKDGISSPAGPMNFGLQQSTAEFVAVMGSDDEFAPGALDSWLALQKSTGADFVIAQIRNVGGGLVPSPPARPRRSRNLDPVLDRLSYRSAPLGLMKRSAFPGLHFAEGLASGEDLPFVTELWFTASSVAFDRTGPAYLVHADAEDRVTSAPRPIADDFAFLELIVEAPWAQNLSRRQRQAIGIKLIRGHVFDAIVNRARVGIPENEWTDLVNIVSSISRWSHSSEKFLSSLDRSIFEGILRRSLTVPEMMALIAKRWNYRTLDVLVPRNPLLVFHSQAPLRTYIGGYFI